MRNLLTGLLIAASMFGCASRQTNNADYVQPVFQAAVPSRVSLSADMGIAKNDLTNLTERLKRTTSPEEILKLQAEIDFLKKRIQELEEKMAELPAIESNTTASPTVPSYRGAAGPVYTGPRGGRYTISPSGKKQYIRKRR